MTDGLVRMVLVMSCMVAGDGLTAQDPQSPDDTASLAELLNVHKAAVSQHHRGVELDSSYM